MIKLSLFLIISILIVIIESTSLVTFVSPKNNEGCNFKYSKGYSELMCNDKSVYKYSTNDEWTSIQDFIDEISNEQYLLFYNSVNGNYDIIQVKTGSIKSSDFIQPNCVSILLENNKMELNCILIDHEEKNKKIKINYSIDINNGLSLNK